MEAWKLCAGWENLYEVSDMGRVRSLERQIVVKDPKGRLRPRNYKGRILSACIGSHGYRAVSFTAPGRKRETICVHVLVARHFVEGQAPGLEVCHKDGNKLNCCATNLRWDTRQANAIDVVKHGASNPPRGERCSHAKLSDACVRWLRSESTAGISCREIARRLGMSHRVVADARFGRSWRHVA